MKRSTQRGIIPVRVLVVDGEPLIRWSICAALIAAGFEADSASTADEAVRLAAAGAPLRVVLLDVHPDGQPQMPIEQIRAISPDSRFLVMSTARQTSETLRRFGEAQMVEKPFDLTNLVSSVSELAYQTSLPAEHAE